MCGALSRTGCDPLTKMLQFLRPKLVKVQERKALSLWTSLGNLAKAVAVPESFRPVSPVLLFPPLSPAFASEATTSETMMTRAVDSWKVFSDREYGGQSTSMFDVTEGVLSFNGKLDYDARDSEEFNKKAKLRGGRVEKSHDTDDADNDPLPVAVRGYCAIKGYFGQSVDLRDYEGLELELWSSINQRYILNMSCESLFDGDLYQCAIDLQADKWSKLHVPFTIMKLTAGGYERNLQRLSDSLQVENLGFLVSQSQSQSQSQPQNEDLFPIPTSFTLKCRKIVALPVLDEQIMFRSKIGYK